MKTIINDDVTYYSATDAAKLLGHPHSQKLRDKAAEMNALSDIRGEDWRNGEMSIPHDALLTIARRYIHTAKNGNRTKAAELVDSLTIQLNPDLPEETEELPEVEEITQETTSLPETNPQVNPELPTGKTNLTKLIDRLPSRLSVINYLEIALVGIGLQRLFGYSGIILGIMVCLYLLTALENATNPKLRSTNNNALQVVLWLCIASFFLHVVTFYNEGTSIEEITDTNPIAYIRLAVAMIPAGLVSVLSYQAIQLTVESTQEKNKD